MLEDVKVKAWIRTANRSKNRISYAIDYRFSMADGGSQRLQEIFRGRGMDFLGLSQNEMRDISKILASRISTGKNPEGGLRTNIFNQ
jgi:hypothetical protein